MRPSEFCLVSSLVSKHWCPIKLQSCTAAWSSRACPRATQMGAAAAAAEEEEEACLAQLFSEKGSVGSRPLAKGRARLASSVCPSACSSASSSIDSRGALIR